MHLRPKVCLVLGAIAALLNPAAFAVTARRAYGKNEKQAASTQSSMGAPKDSGKDVGSGKPIPPDTSDPGLYRIGIGDELQISVWKEPDLSTGVVVRPDGKITLPLLNDIYVVGLQTTDLQALLIEKLKPFVNEPQVTVVVRGIKSRKVYVYGQVAKAGAYSLVERKTVLEVLAEAGGLGTFAKKRSIYVLREVDHKQIRIPFNYNDALKAKKPNDNFELFPGDIVVVP